MVAFELLIYHIASSMNTAGMLKNKYKKLTTHKKKNKGGSKK